MKYTAWIIVRLDSRLQLFLNNKDRKTTVTILEFFSKKAIKILRWLQETHWLYDTHISIYAYIIIYNMNTHIYIYMRHRSIIIVIHSILFPTELSSISTYLNPSTFPFCTDRPPPPSWESCRTGKSFATDGLAKRIKVIVTSQYSPCRSSLIHHVHGLSRWNQHFQHQKNLVWFVSRYGNWTCIGNLKKWKVDGKGFFSFQKIVIFRFHENF